MKLAPGGKPCDICGKPRGTGRDHTACSLKRKEQHKGDADKQYVQRNGKAAVWPSGNPITVKQHQEAKYRTSKANYKAGKSFTNF